jgi:molybdenum cofactor biosynthesis enzyme MoaA
MHVIFVVCIACRKMLSLVNVLSIFPYTELIKIIENLVSLGIDEVRLTGGEPTLSPDFMKIVRGLEHLPLEKLALTTNGLTFKNMSVS